MLADSLPTRWMHTQGVAGQARAVGPLLGWDTDLIESAAWLHDIGYAPALAASRFHPLDGARYLRDVEHADPCLCLLVANHTGALGEARERGLADVLRAEFPVRGEAEIGLVAAVTYCDLTTGPQGERLTPQERLDEILSRYPPDGPVHRAIQASAPGLLAQCREITTALGAACAG